MNGVGPRVRWAASAVLAVVAIWLVLSFTRHGPAPVAARDVGTAAPVTPATGDPAAGDSASAGPGATASGGARTSAGATAVPTPGSASASLAQNGAPLRPDAAKGLGVASAESFVRFYFGEAANYLKLTGDGAAVRAASSPACRPCTEDVAIFARTNGRNHCLMGDYLWKSIEVRAVRITGARSAAVDVDLRRGRHTAIEKPGAKPTSHPGGPASLTVTLIAVGDDWQMFDMALRVGEPS